MKRFANSRSATSLFIVAVSTAINSMSSAATIYTDNFNAPTNANFTIVKGNSAGTPYAAGTTGANAQTAAFGFDYSAFGIPAAPGSSDTLGLQLKSNIFGGSQSGLAAFLTTATLPTAYQIQFQVWSNYVTGGAAAINSTEAASFGLGSGTKAPVSAGGDGVYFTTLRDNATSTSGTYRNYFAPAATPTVTGLQNFKLGTSGTLPADFPSKTINQTGPVNGVATANPVTTVAGTDSFAWRTVTITNDTASTTLTISNDIGGTDTIFTVADTTIGSASTALLPFIGSYDTNNGSSFTASTTPTQADLDGSAPVQFNFELYDNFSLNSITPAPEPGSLALLGIGGLGLMARRRRV